MGIRDLKNKSRMALHKAMSVPAIYVNLDSRPPQEIPCSVRDHTKSKAMGDMAGFDYAPVERLTLVPEIVSLAADVSPVRGGVFSIAADEAYSVEIVMPRDGITVTTQVTVMKQSEIDAFDLPYPGKPVPETV
jgi:hypothetical protein